MKRNLTSKPFKESKVTTAPKGECIAKLEQEFKTNDAYFAEIQKQVDSANIGGAYEELIKKAGEMCSTEQLDRLKALLKKYQKLQENVQALAPGYPLSVRHEVLDWMRDGNLLALMNFLGRENMASVLDQSKSTKLMQTTLDLASMQIELLFNPI
ncbi:hypothetical protein COOONC_04575 [Cooperia oncophora]